MIAVWSLLFGFLAPPAPGALPVPPPPARNLLLVSIDSLRADHLAPYGYPRSTMPELESLIARRGGTVFDRTTAVSPSCHPSHTAMLTGLYPQQVGVPWCGEDLIVRQEDLTAEEIEALESYQSALRDEPPRMREKKLSAVMNWLRVPEGTPTLATLLRAAGFRTGGFVSIWTLGGRFGHGVGFDRFVDDMPEYYGPSRLGWLLRDTFESQRRQVGERTVDEALEFLAEVPGDGRFFVFLHFGDTHVPYAPRGVPAWEETPAARERVENVWRSRYPPEDWERADRRMRAGDEVLLDRYDRSIRYVDGQLARVLSALEKSGRLEETLVVITSDHGDSFGQHRYLSSTQGDRLFFEHSVYVWEETQAVPLIVLAPGDREIVHRRVNASQVDLLPTALGGLGLAASGEGISNVGEDLRAVPDQDRTVFFLTFGRGRPGLLRAVRLDFPKFIGFRRGDLKFFVDRERLRDPEAGRCFLFDLERDPDELHNLCDLDAARRRQGAGYREILVDWYGRSLAGRPVGRSSRRRDGS